MDNPDPPSFPGCNGQPDKLFSEYPQDHPLTVPVVHIPNKRGKICSNQMDKELLTTRDPVIMFFDKPLLPEPTAKPLDG